MPSRLTGRNPKATGVYRRLWGPRVAPQQASRALSTMSRPPTTAAITGTATASIAETDIVTGSKTVIITLTNDTWAAAGASFDAQRQNIINGMDSNGAEAAGWDAVVKATQGVAGVVRTSNTVVTVTLDAQATYDITATETITVTVPSTALVASAINVVGSPTFSISATGAVSTKRFLSLLGVGS